MRIFDHHVKFARERRKFPSSKDQWASVSLESPAGGWAILRTSNKMGKQTFYGVVSPYDVEHLLGMFFFKTRTTPTHAETEVEFEDGTRYMLFKEEERTRCHVWNGDQREDLAKAACFAYGLNENIYFTQPQG